MVTHLRNFLEEHGLYVTVVKYLFTIFLSVMSYRNHSDWGYILVTAVEVISIAAITNIFAKEQMQHHKRGDNGCNIDRNHHRRVFGEPQTEEVCRNNIHQV